MTISIKPITPDDLDDFVTSVGRLFREDAGTRDPARNVQWAAQHGAGYYRTQIGQTSSLLLLARDGAGEPLGHLIGRLGGPSDMWTIRYATLESIQVNDTARGRGVGTALVEQFTSWARANDAERMYVTAYAANEGALR
ncbi:MAG: GNAT family N-acetyltransferase, partial [Thermoactinospora sp.]|nr:GNAT family N-acetyltransferase [Thermoactinospora sp.]